MQLRKLNLLLAILLACHLTVFFGCSHLKKARAWPAPLQSAPDRPWNREVDQADTIGPKLARAELVYASAIEAMKCDDPTCVDAFYQAALLVWRCWSKNPQAIDCTQGRAAELYRSSLIGLVHEGQRLQRFDPRRGLRVHIHGEWLDIPLQYYGFPWTAEDFNELEVVGAYETKDINHIYRCSGVGVPTVATRLRCQKENFLSKEVSFPATILLRCNSDGSSSHDAEAVLELYDPLRVPTVTIGDRAFPLASDKSAHLAKSLSSESRNYLQAFLQPGIVTPDERGLMMLEPYQPGKIPVVLVHGLLSDQLTWINLVNEVSSRPDLLDRYQLWAFQYPTGEPFLRSAATLRSDLAALRMQMDPTAHDTALQQTVLVGHSMGGLISKMQIASSGDAIWRAYANRPFEEVVMDEAIRERLQKAAFFEPSPMVSRVVFIGTPHRGSVIAQRALGRFASLMVRVRPEMAQEHRRLIENNPCTFSDEFSRRIPTSIDLLEPTSPSLAVMDQLPLKSDVEIHSIIGRGSWMPGSGESDGVVPVSSALFSAAISEKFVNEKHSRLTYDEEVMEEVLHILSSHACSKLSDLAE